MSDANHDYYFEVPGGVWVDGPIEQTGSAQFLYNAEHMIYDSAKLDRPSPGENDPYEVEVDGTTYSWCENHEEWEGVNYDPANSLRRLCVSITWAMDFFDDANSVIYDLLEGEANEAEEIDSLAVAHLCNTMRKAVMVFADNLQSALIHLPELAKDHFRQLVIADQFADMGPGFVLTNDSQITAINMTPEEEMAAREDLESRPEVQDLLRRIKEANEQ